MKSSPSLSHSALNRIPFTTAFLLLAFALPSVVQAHTGAGQTVGFFHGTAHPVTGLDHLCAMLAVGLWAAQRGGRAVWLVPLTFVSVMAFGGVLGMASVPLPLVEQGILASVLVMGVLIAVAARLPLAASSILVGLFALFHGHAHGAEMPENTSGLAYGLGFILATAGLHGCGIGLGLLVRKLGSERLMRYAGGAITACGLYLCFAQ